MKGKVLPFLTGMMLVILATCPSHASQVGGEKIKTFVSIISQRYFVERVGGELVAVRVLVGEGQSHETYEPSPAQMSQLAGSRIFFAIGAPFERALVPKIAGVFPELPVIDTSKGVKFISFSPGSGEHGPDPHIWLDPKRVRIIARNIHEGLARIDPVHREMYRKNLEAFQDDLNKLDSEIAEILAPIKGRKIYVFHPAFGYFCESYGLQQVALEVEGKEPSARQIARLIENTRKENVKTIFVQPQFSQKSARAIARAIGGKVVTINPLPENYLTEMKKMAETIRASLAGKE